MDRHGESLGIIAHEIKRPIAAVISLLQAAEPLLHKPGMEEALDLIQRAVKRAKSALDLSRNLMEYVQTNHVQSQEEDRSGWITPHYMNQLIEKHSQMAATRNVRLICEFIGTDFLLALKPMEYDLIANNLISNAIRYSKRGAGSQRVWIRTNKKDNFFILEVQDEGIGMSEVDQKKVFDGFFRTAEAKDQTVSGTGLGMAIVKKIADSCGAEIRFQSIVGQGTTFQVTFPLKPDSKIINQSM